eukprot:scaffold7430_cov156-Skeletonema_dohrnii-CCMP3373.AAC.18
MKGGRREGLVKKTAVVPLLSVTQFCKMNPNWRPLSSTVQWDWCSSQDRTIMILAQNSVQSY